MHLETKRTFEEDLTANWASATGNCSRNVKPELIHACFRKLLTKECCNAIAVVVVSPQRGYLLIHRFCSADRFSLYIESPGYLCALQYSTTLFPSVSTNALGMFSGAKYAHRTFRPIIKKHHYNSATANKYPCKKSFTNIYVRNPTDIKSYACCIKIVSSLTRSPS